MEIYKYQYEEFEEDLKTILTNIKNYGQKYDCVVALFRGGLSLGVRMSHELELPLAIIDYQRLDGNSKSPILAINKEIIENSESILLVDDLLDEGISAAKALDLIYDINANMIVDVAVLYMSNKVKEEYYNALDRMSGKTFHGKKFEDKWIQFIPWEGDIKSVE